MHCTADKSLCRTVCDKMISKPLFSELDQPLLIERSCHSSILCWVSIFKIFPQVSREGAMFLPYTLLYTCKTSNLDTHIVN